MAGWDAFMAGFLGTMSKNIGERKDEAKEYFDKRMEMAFEMAHQFRSENKEKMQGTLTVARQLKAVGVPDKIVMAIANQNPDDLSTFYNTIQDMQLRGVKFTPESYEAMFNVDGEFNPGNESVASTIQKIYQPLTANIQADPEGWEFDPKGTMWATMMGHNAMDRARAKLATTEVMPGVSAADVLYNGNQLNKPFGDTTVVFNAESAHDMIKEAKGDDRLSPSQRISILSSLDKWAEEERVLLPEDMPLEERQREAYRRAAERVLLAVPEAYDFDPVIRWLDPSSEGAPEERDVKAAPSPETMDEIETPSESPSEPRTEVPSEASTPAPTIEGTLPERLPNGAVLKRDRGDGTSEWIMPDGSEKRVRNEEIWTMLGSESTGIPAYRGRIPVPTSGAGDTGSRELPFEPKPLPKFWGDNTGIPKGYEHMVPSN